MNIALAIMHIFPDSSPLFDFEVRDDGDGKGQYIASWNLTEPLPTEEELQSAWAELQALPTPEPLPELPDVVEGLKSENKLLRAQLNAQSERSDFIEDCIAEMAIMIYS